MSLNLDSVNAKLQRADQHNQFLHDEIAAWMATNSYVTRPVVSPDQTRYAIVAYHTGKKLRSKHGHWWLVIASITSGAPSITSSMPLPSISEVQIRRQTRKNFSSLSRTVTLIFKTAFLE